MRYEYNWEWIGYHENCTLDTGNCYSISCYKCQNFKPYTRILTTSSYILLDWSITAKEKKRKEKEIKPKKGQNTKAKSVQPKLIDDSMVIQSG